MKRRYWLQALESRPHGAGIGQSLQALPLRRKPGAPKGARRRPPQSKRILSASAAAPDWALVGGSRVREAPLAMCRVAAAWGGALEEAGRRARGTRETQSLTQPA